MSSSAEILEKINYFVADIKNTKKILETLNTSDNIDDLINIRSEISIVKCESLKMIELINEFDITLIDLLDASCDHSFKRDYTSDNHKSSWICSKCGICR